MWILDKQGMISVSISMFQMLHDILILKKLFVPYLKFTFKWVSCILFGNPMHKSNENMNSLGTQKRERLSGSQEEDAEAELGGQRFRTQEGLWKEKGENRVGWGAVRRRCQPDQGSTSISKSSDKETPPWGVQAEQKGLDFCTTELLSLLSTPSSQLGQSLMLKILSLCHHSTTRENRLDPLPFLNTTFSLNVIIEKCLPKIG